MVMGELTQETDLLVVGSGPGGYAAAFRAADLGLDVTMVDLGTRPGGTCLFEGCIPSKTYLHLAELIFDATKAESMGINFNKPRIDLEGMKDWKGRVIDQMANGLVNLNKRRGVQLLQGRAEFEDSQTVRLRDSEISRLKFKHAILATGSTPIPFPGTEFASNGRIMSSTGALELHDVPENLLVIGGGYIGLELGTVYAALGSKVTLVEVTDSLLAGIDQDLVEPLHRNLKKIFDSIALETKVLSLDEKESQVEVIFQGNIDPSPQSFDRVLVAIGRKPNSDNIGLENTGVKLDERGFVQINEQQQTTDERIFAVGDVAGGMMLAHKAMREGKVAAEVIAGIPSAFDVRAIPAVVYTDPQIAWCGLTETEAKKENRAVKIQKFPWKFSGRAVTMGAPEGLTKILVDPESGRILGMGIAGRHTEGLISEGVLAIEMGALAEDMALSIHPHPTLSETEGEAAEIFLGSTTHIISKSLKQTN
jgi:dihydrolipoamide dehydrogenase